MNEKENYRMKALQLSKIGVISYVAVAFVGLVYGIMRNVSRGDQLASNTWSLYHVIAIFLLAVYFLPLVRRVHFYAEKAECKNIVVITNLITAFLLVILLFVLILLVKGLIVVV